MYADRSDIQNCRLNLSISRQLERRIEAEAEARSAQKSAYARELIEWALANVHLRHGANSVIAAVEMRAAN